MGITKTEHFTAHQNQLAALAKALGHPARIAILQYLLQRPTCVCGDIVDELPLAQSTVSQHLKELKAAGLIQGSVEGTSVCYCINPARWQQVRELFSALFAGQITCNANCC